VASYRPIEADTDPQALQLARRFVDGCDVEVWYLDRKIGRLERVKE
jgi:DNA modification methylase